MKRYLLLGLTVFSGAAQAQTSGTMQVQLEVLPRVLTVSVSSSHLDFAQQRADAGAVTLDPATGLASHKAGGPHAMGEVIVQGPAGAGFLVSIDSPVTLQQTGTRNEVRFTSSWAQSRGCNQGAFMLIPTRQTATGVLGKDGCAALRFGGTVHLLGTAQGRYAGHLAVRITPL
ncbi:MAG: hypothetical protein F4065_06045 [Rhodothermaceae bacterium]|nr:hypothetical protein [Rhodothermaceae bacterium]MXZ16795.1 hypothetical protein [Rhodothermaceae bacterium]MXZ58677.1 hypothetical protein [Rhodothermaceae bacterium]MYB91370.1 hypothetical protein [Rhodothermaceae bacterium]MYD68011.1 hypothetical protein [Rhodothermaceae bacterium]